MSEIVAQDEPDVRKTSRFTFILILVTVFLPHTLEIRSVSQPDYSYVRYTLFAVFGMISQETGSTIVGPYSSTLFEFISFPALLFSFLFLPLYIIVIIAQWRFTKGKSSKRTILRVVGLSLFVQAVILFAFFWHQADGWLFNQSYPLPIIHALSILAVVRQGDSESN